jgi:hypothetical protein
VKERTQSPFEATVIVTPVELSTTALHEPLDTVAASTGETKKTDGIAIIDTTKRLTAPTKANFVRVGKKRRIMTKSYS